MPSAPGSSHPIFGFGLDQGLAGAASTAVRHLVSGPVRPARVLGVFPVAVYLHVPGGRQPDVLALVAADGVRLPNAVTVAAPAAQTPWREVDTGTPAEVGAGQVRLGEVLVSATRWWAPRASPPPPSPKVLRDRLALFARVLPAEPAPELAAALDELAAAGAALDRDRAVGALRRLIGHGEGLTPSGDDLVAGFLTTLRHHARRAPLRLFTETLAVWLHTTGARATTTLSATLLLHAAQGRAPDEVVDVLDALAGRRAAPLARLDRLVRIGHRSGYDLARGVLAAAGVVLEHMNREEG
ncbi:hypothetical protein C3Y87_16460 [Carbonactinospora thermoautotrophica]|uniref:oxamate carbamoyltransferase subunit AllH family protein n=1 Tax=Carbonactinospora thermoautotrophica TaxID=1469144 RepID=UPI0022702AB8|nr:DUF2877 domain-containing protein [Carbonactinospora thermoautotrophica]MCX9192977.1 hypothetical protein [Carbonactinospora thermoautotrophica]